MKQTDSLVQSVASTRRNVESHSHSHGQHRLLSLPNEPLVHRHITSYKLPQLSRVREIPCFSPRLKASRKPYARQLHIQPQTACLRNNLLCEVEVFHFRNHVGFKMLALITPLCSVMPTLNGFTSWSPSTSLRGQLRQDLVSLDAIGAVVCGSGG